MKIAILFIGYARTFEQLKDNYIKYFPCHADVFIQTYDTFYAIPTLDTICSSNNVTYTNIDTFKSVFPNIKYFSNPMFNANKMKNTVIKHKIPIKNDINQETYRSFATFTNLKNVILAKSNFEKKNNFKYDCVIITRLDLKLDTPLIIPRNLNKLYFPIGEGYFENNKRRIGCAKIFGTNKTLNDQIMITKSAICDKLFDIVDKIPTYYKEKIMVNNETLIGFHCLKKKIVFEPYDMITYSIFR
jgi:hypothetical protein